MIFGQASHYIRKLHVIYRSITRTAQWNITNPVVFLFHGGRRRRAHPGGRPALRRGGREIVWNGSSEGGCSRGREAQLFSQRMHVARSDEYELPWESKFVFTRRDLWLLHCLL